jgi:hypothetical protein
VSSRRAFGPLFVLFVACAGDGDGAVTGGDGSDPPADAASATPDAGDVSQTPPTGDAAALEAWLAAGHYLTWHCEPEPHPARPPGAHGRNRICSNDALAAATAPYPVGAASVKELHGASGIVGYAVSSKQQAESANGAGWYWYERFGGTTYADGPGVSLCTGCHVDATDYVFTRVP